MISVIWTQLILKKFMERERNQKLNTEISLKQVRGNQM